MGRKQEVQNPKFIGGDIEIEDWEELEKIRWREHKERAEILRIAIQEYIRSHAEGNDTFKLDTWNKDPEFQAVPTFLSTREKWLQYYKDSNEKDRTRLRIQVMDLSKIFRNIDFNENRK